MEDFNEMSVDFFLFPKIEDAEFSDLWTLFFSFFQEIYIHPIRHEQKKCKVEKRVKFNQSLRQ